MEGWLELLHDIRNHIPMTAQGPRRPGLVFRGGPVC